MNYSIKQLSNGRWGICAEQKLLATIESQQMALKVLTLLKTSERSQKTKVRYPQISNFIATNGLATPVA